MAETKELTKAYIAGLFDGEGCVSVHKVQDQRSKKKGNLLYRYYLKAIIVSTSKDMIDFINKHYSGSVSERTKRNPNHADQWAWQLSGMKAVSFFNDIYPYLIVKKEQASLAMKWSIAKSKSYMTEDMRKERLEIYAAVKSLKSPSIQNIVWHNGHTKGISK